MSNLTVSAYPLEWSIVVFARNEEARISDCLIAIANAVQGVQVEVVLIINGCSDKTREIALALLPTLGFSARVYTIELACKSHAMNLFIHDLRPDASLYFFVDGATFVEPHALHALASGLDRNPDLMAVSGLPLNGRGAAKMRQDALHASKLFGQMFAVRKSCLDELSSRERRLPIGLYRGDGLLVGFIGWETDGVAHEYMIPRIATIPEAQWRIRPIFWLTFRDVRTGFNRLIRQARGRLENQAWNSILWTQGFGALPRFADEMILHWLQTNRLKKELVVDQFFTWLALWQIRRWRRPDDAALQAHKILEMRPNQSAEVNTAVPDEKYSFINVPIASEVDKINLS